jgi:glycosyltransferase involved in cell wall biosynthesis
MPYISVVVPVYNVESYLSLCLQTIREQSLSDIEIICVNDGATDRSLSLLKLFAATDDRIRIIDKPNGGLSSARNVGILAARADYIMLVDSDDLLERDACEVVYASFVKHNADIVTFGANCYPSSEVDEWLTDCLGPRDVFYDAFSIDILVNEKSHPFVWRSAFSANFLKSTSLLFDETVLFGEDEVFYLAAYPRAQRVAFISKRLYNYRLARKDSLMSSRFADTLIRAKEHIVIVDRVLTDWKQQGWLDEYPMQILNWALDFIAGHIKAEAQIEQPELLKSLRVVLNRSISPSLIADSRVPGYTRELLLHLLDESTARVDTRIYNNWRFFSHSKTQRIVYARRLLTSACRKVLRRVLPVPASRNEQYLVDLESRISIRQEEELRAAKALQYLLAEYLEKKESHNLYPVTVEAVNKRISQH